MLAKLTLEWFYAASIRAIKTIAQTALGMFTVGAAMNEVNWKYVISVSVVAGIYSMLTSIATKLPEVGSDGTLQIDTTSGTTDIYRLSIDNALENLATKSIVKLKVDTNAVLSRE